MYCLRFFCLVVALLAAPAFAQQPMSSPASWGAQVSEAKNRVPPTQIENYLKEHYYGRMLTIKLDDDDGLLTYEVRWLGNDDQVVEFRFNARTGELFWMKGINIRRLERKKP